MPLSECTFCGNTKLNQFVDKNGWVIAYCPSCNLLIRKRPESK